MSAELLSLANGLSYEKRSSVNFGAFPCENMCFSFSKEIRSLDSLICQPLLSTLVQRSNRASEGSARDRIVEKYQPDPEDRRQVFSPQRKPTRQNHDLAQMMIIVRFGSTLIVVLGWNPSLIPLQFANRRENHLGIGPRLHTRTKQLNE